MKKRLIMVIDASKCIDCKACMAACKVANNVPAGYWRNWIKSENEELAVKSGKRQVFQPGNCMHCDDATCVTACPTGATYKDKKDATVKINRDLCIGCGQCLPACPYGARYRHTELRVADKCDYCQSRREAGLEPACVETCPTKARAFGDANDASGEVANLLKKNNTKQVVNRYSDTKPGIYYIGDPGPKHWPVEARMPEAFEFWKNLAGPAVKAFIGITGLGVLGMLGKQLFLDDPPPEHHPPKDLPNDKKGGCNE